MERVIKILIVSTLVLLNRYDYVYNTGVEQYNEYRQGIYIKDLTKIPSDGIGYVNYGIKAKETL
jgi:hypothetical protein